MKNLQQKLIALGSALTLACAMSWAQQASNAVSSPDAAGATAPSASASAPDAAPSAATSAAKPGDSTPDLKFHDRYPRYTLRSGDSFDINFELSPEFNQQGVSVQPDGFITLRGVGDVHVAGQTVPELNATIRAAYNKILNDPLVSITLKDFEKPYFIADGQIGHPGKYELRGDTTLTEAIAMAGGFEDTSKHSQVLLFRRVSDRWSSAQIYDVKKMETSKNLSEDPLLHPGDMLFVPKNRFSKIRAFLPTASLGTFAKTY
jgi:polysaccharide export outer membrane protein